MSLMELHPTLRALYHNNSGASEASHRGDAESHTSSFGSTLKQTIQRMNELYHQADSALKTLSTSHEPAIKEEIEQIDHMHKQIMEAQYKLMSLYKKVKTDPLT